MVRNLHPSPSEIVMTAMFHLDRDQGTSLEDIVKYAKSKYGLSDENIKNRISYALRRGLKYKILHKKNGLYSLNRSIVKIPSKIQGKPIGERKKDAANEKKDSGKDENFVKKAQRMKKKKSKLFLCPDCRVKTNGEAAPKAEGENRHEIRPRNSPSGNGEKGGSATDSKEGDKSRRKTRWKDFIRMGISFRGRRPNPQN